jgi:hypothetical protein
MLRPNLQHQNCWVLSASLLLSCCCTGVLLTACRIVVLLHHVAGFELLLT